MSRLAGIGGLFLMLGPYLVSGRSFDFSWGRLPREEADEPVRFSVISGDGLSAVSGATVCFALGDARCTCCLALEGCWVAVEMRTSMPGVLVDLYIFADAARVCCRLLSICAGVGLIVNAVDIVAMNGGEWWRKGEESAECDEQAGW